MEISTRARRLGCSTLVALGCLATPALGLTPVTGDWEGTGPHGLPLSFGLGTRHGRIVATGVALGFPRSCPAEARDAQAVPLSGLAYTGPGATPANPLDGDTVEITGQSGPRDYLLTGVFASARSGAFSTLTNQHVGCGWPSHSLNWSVHPARRRTVDNGTWRGTAAGGGLSRATVVLTVAAGGRVVTSFAAQFYCLGGGGQGFGASSTNEFVTDRGAFTTPRAARGAENTWSGQFDGRGHLSGQIQVPSLCGGGARRIDFRATHAR